MDRRTVLKITAALLTVNTATAKETAPPAVDSVTVERIDNTIVVSSEGNELRDITVSAVQALTHFMQEKGLEVDGREEARFKIEFFTRNGEIEGKPAWKGVSPADILKRAPDGGWALSPGLLGGMRAIVGPRDKKDRLSAHDIQNGRMVSIIERAFDLTVRQNAMEKLEAAGEKLPPSREKRQAAQDAIRASLEVHMCKLFVPIA